MREPQLIVATGTKGVGKTYKTCQIIQKYLTPNLTTGKKARKVLIFDVNGEYNNTELEKNGFRFRTKVLALKDLPDWSKQKKVEVRRILAVDANGNKLGTDMMPEILRIILHYYTGGFLLLEDINKYLTENQNGDIIGALTTNRHKDLDIYIHLQSLSKLTTTMWQNANIMRVHYQLDPIDRYKARINNFELFKIAQLMVNTNYLTGKKRFYINVYNEDNKIKGQYSKRDFIIACRKYLEQNTHDLKISMLKYGKNKDAKLNAMKDCIKELFVKYYGNSKLRAVA